MEATCKQLLSFQKDMALAVGTSSLSHLSSSALVVRSEARVGRPPTSQEPRAVKKRAADRLLKQRKIFFPRFFSLLLEVGAPDKDLQEIFCTFCKKISPEHSHFAFLQELVEGKVLTGNVRNVVEKFGKNASNKAPLVAVFTAGLSKGFVENQLKLDPNFAAKSRSELKKSEGNHGLFDLKYLVGTTRTSVVLEEKLGICQWSKGVTRGGCSGSRSKTYIVDLTKKDLFYHYLSEIQTVYGQILSYVTPDTPIPDAKLDENLNSHQTNLANYRAWLANGKKGAL
jgi:hypothetical protein